MTTPQTSAARGPCPMQPMGREVRTPAPALIAQGGSELTGIRRMRLGECTSGEPGVGSPRGAAPAREFSSKPSVPFETEAQAADSVRGRPGRATAPTGADRIWADARALGIPRDADPGTSRWVTAASLLAIQTSAGVVSGRCRAYDLRHAPSSGRCADSRALRRAGS
jgi:hypothetical protein